MPKKCKLLLSKLQEYLNSVYNFKINCNIILSTDFYFDFLNDTTEVNDLRSLMDSFELRQTIFKPTRPGRDESIGTCVDNVFTNINNDKYFADVIDTILSDHDPIFFSSIINKTLGTDTCSRSIPTTIRPINAINVNYFNYLLSNMNWFEVYNLIEVNEKATLLLNLLLEAINICFPLSLINRRHTKKIADTRWYTSDLKTLKEECLFYYNLFVQTNIIQVKNKYIELRRQYKKNLKLAKLNYFSNLVNNSSNKSKTIWTIVNETLHNNTKSNTIITGLDAETMNNFFIDKVDEVVSSILPNCDPMEFMKSYNKMECVFIFKHVTVEEVYTAILNLSNSMCLDVFQMNTKILKIAVIHICEPLVHIFNCCIDNGV